MLVRELAKEVIPILLFGNTSPAPTSAEGERAESQMGLGAPPSAAAGIMGQRGGSGMRRTTSETMLDVGRERGAVAGTAMAFGPSMASGLSAIAAGGREGALSAQPRGASQRDRIRPLSREEGREPRERENSYGSSSTASSRVGGSAIGTGPPIAGERPKHKRRISRSQLR